MKTQISLLQFHNKVKELAEKAGKTYCKTYVNFAQFLDKEVKIQFECYVDGYEVYTASTPIEALTKLKLAIFPPRQSISDAVVEVEGWEEV